MDDEQFAASFKEVLEERTRNVKWAVLTERDGLDTKLVVSATVQVEGQYYTINMHQDLEHIYRETKLAGVLAEQFLIDVTLSWFMRRLEREVFCCVYPYRPKEERDGKRD